MLYILIVTKYFKVLVPSSSPQSTNQSTNKSMNQEEEESETPPWITTIETATATELPTTTAFETIPSTPFTDVTETYSTPFTDVTETYSTPYFTDVTETYSTPYFTDVTDTATTSFTYVEESTPPITAPFNSTTDDYWTDTTSPPKGNHSLLNYHLLLQ